MIESLKQNKTVFGELSKDEKKCLKEVGKVNCQVRDAEWDQAHGEGFFPGATYRIKPDYQPEPQIERCEVDPEELSYRRQGDDEVPTPIQWALSDPDFMYFEYENGGKLVSPRSRVAVNVNTPAGIPKFVVFRKR